MLDEEAILTVTIFLQRQSAFYPGQQYNVLARNTLGDLHRVMYCSLSAILTEEDKKGNLPPEVTAPSLSFFFIESKFYVMDR